MIINPIFSNIITPIKHKANNGVESSNKIAFKNSSIKTDIYERDDNISYFKKDRYNKLISVGFKRPISLEKALNSLISDNNRPIKNELYRCLHPEKEIIGFIEDVSSDPQIAEIKVSSLYGIGAFALAFETEDNKILKITGMEHFPFDRDIADFDLPIEKKGQIGYSRYYLEEKVSQDDITQEELKELCANIISQGYTLKDYVLELDENAEMIIKTQQFGRAKNGKIYLIDPGCAIAPHRPKENRLTKAFNKLFK